MRYEQQASWSHSKEIGQIKAWCLAARPKTLPPAIIPVIVGVCLAKSTAGEINWVIACLTLISSCFILIGTNLINDGWDFKRGVDNKERLGPRRATQSGWIPLKQILMGGFLCFGLAFLTGIPLILQGGWPLLVVLLLSVVSGYLYTGGPKPLGYHGWGELFVLLFFGWVATASSYYLQTGFVDQKVLLAGTQIGLLAVVIIAINNLRDIIGDAKTAKRTLAVRFGKKFMRYGITLAALFPFVLGLFWLRLGYPWVTFLPYLILPLSYQNLKDIWMIEPSIQYNSFFGRSALIQLIFGFLLSVGFLLK